MLMTMNWSNKGVDCLLHHNFYSNSFGSFGTETKAENETTDTFNGGLLCYMDGAFSISGVKSL